MKVPLRGRIAPHERNIIAAKIATIALHWCYGSVICNFYPGNMSLGASEDIVNSYLNRLRFLADIAAADVKVTVTRLIQYRESEGHRFGSRKIILKSYPR